MANLSFVDSLSVFTRLCVCVCVWLPLGCPLLFLCGSDLQFHVTGQHQEPQQLFGTLRTFPTCR